MAREKVCPNFLRSWDLSQAFQLKDCVHIITFASSTTEPGKFVVNMYSTMQAR